MVKYIKENEFNNSGLQVNSLIENLRKILYNKINKEIIDCPSIDSIVENLKKLI